MEVFAGFGEYADTEIGRLIDAIGATGQPSDNTLFFTSSAITERARKAGMNGLYNEMT